MRENLMLAILILFLLMAALFRLACDSLLVLLTVPLATVGRVIALRLLNLVSFQPLDLLTMIGFVILMGLVVDSARPAEQRTPGRAGRPTSRGTRGHHQGAPGGVASKS